MAFISGPRQVGKTTLAMDFKNHYDEFIYKNWDDDVFRRLWTKNPSDIVQMFQLAKAKSKRLVIFDEIHKAKGWKQKIKGLYDLNAKDIQIIVTGSARLNIFKKGGDSLLGRYINFRLHPFSYGELSSDSPLSPEVWRAQLFQEKRKDRKGNQKIIDQLFQMSGFPEPYLENSVKILNIWRRGRNEKIIREDLRDISRLPELSQIEMLASLLPEKVGSPLSIESLREDIGVSHDTITRWMNYLKELYYFFEVKPWTKSIKRSLKKEGKIYLYDWTSVEEKGHRFENLVAEQLLKACHFWTDIGEGNFDLFYLRNKEKQEIDFLIVKDSKPWLTVESKYSDSSIDEKTVSKFKLATKCPHLQVLYSDNIYRIKEENVAIISAAKMFEGLP